MPADPLNQVYLMRPLGPGALPARQRWHSPAAWHPNHRPIYKLRFSHFPSRPAVRRTAAFTTLRTFSSTAGTHLAPTLRQARSALRRPAMHHALHQRPLSHGLSENASTRRRFAACLDHYTDFHLAGFARPASPLAGRGILSTRSARHKTEPSTKTSWIGCTAWKKGLRVTCPAIKPFSLPSINSWRQLAISLPSRDARQKASRDPSGNQCPPRHENCTRHR